MNITVFPSYDEMSRKAAQHIADVVNKKPNALVCIAGGFTPLGTMKALVEMSKEGMVDFTQATFVGLDEFVGLKHDDDGSCLETLNTHLFGPMNIKKEQINFFDAASNDLEAELKRIDQVIFDAGGVDVMLLGVGMNGHLGFNEPGVSFENYSHIIDLDDVSTTVGQKYFKEKKMLKQGITLGIKHIMEAKNVILVVDGEKKADIVKKVIESKVTNQIPGTVLHNHKNAFVYMDEKAASKLA